MLNLGFIWLKIIIIISLVGLGHEAGVEPAGAGRGLKGPSSDRRRDLPVGCLSCAACSSVGAFASAGI